MADEAFALSPISARAAQPSEEDYDAISAAFMETSRGRWFLSEYAKRNRNADTRMVLDAVARIEDSLAAQRQPPAENGLPEALADIREAVDRAEAAASAAVGSIATEENLAPIRKGARVIREISWRWREIGTDGRICDLIDSQVSAIEGACGQIASASPQAALRATFDLIRAEIAEFDAIAEDAPATATEAAAAASPARDDTPASPVRSEDMPVPPAPPDDMPGSAALADDTLASAALAQDMPMPAAAEAAAPAAAPIEEAAAAVFAPPMPAATIAVMDEVAETAPEEVHVTAEAVDAAVETLEDIEQTANAHDEDAADAHDEAVLDLIALEMAAPDPEIIDEAPAVEPDAAAFEPAMPAPAEPVVALPAKPAAAAPTPTAAAEPVTMAPAEPVAAPPPQPMVVAEPPAPMAVAPAAPLQPVLQPELEAELSLGSTLIANGILRPRQPSQPDPLAPIRRLSQIEKVALFS